MHAGEIRTILFLIAGLIVFDIGSSIYSPCEQTSEQQETQKSTALGSKLTKHRVAFAV
jgi:hypothetical protein